MKTSLFLLPTKVKMLLIQRTTQRSFQKRKFTMLQRLIFIGILTLVITTSVQAETVSFSNTVSGSDPFSFNGNGRGDSSIALTMTLPQFDPGLGTLTSVSWTDTFVNEGLSATTTNNSITETAVYHFGIFNGTSMNTDFPMPTGFSFNPDLDFAGPNSLEPGESTIQNNPITQLGINRNRNLTGVDVGPYVGTGTLTATRNMSGFSTISNLSGLTNPNDLVTEAIYSSQWTRTITYTFDPAPDDDDDTIPNVLDNCPNIANPLQENNDGDSEGDVCDPDDDNDGVDDTDDNCPLDGNTDQADTDLDGLGDVCDASGDDTIVEQVAEVIVETIENIVAVNPPGGTGMIKKLTGNGGVLKKLDNAVEAFEAGAIDCPTYLAELQSALEALDSFDDQLAAKIANGQIVDPEATDLLIFSDEIRGYIDSLIATSGC